jgi:hypothetical protein
MNEQLETGGTERIARRPMWKEVLIGALWLWIGMANLAPALRIYGAHRGTLQGLFLLVCECLLLVGSGTAMVLGAWPLLVRGKEIAAIGDERGRISAKRVRKLAFVGFLGLAWCLGSLR